jgi:hypothetical protein
MSTGISGTLDSGSSSVTTARCALTERHAMEFGHALSVDTGDSPAQRRRSLLPSSVHPTRLLASASPIVSAGVVRSPLPPFPVHQMLVMPPGQALTSHFPATRGVDQSCQSVLRHH